MDKSLDDVLDAGIVHQQDFDSFNSSSMSQMGTSYFGINTEKPVRDNKPLPYFDIKASEERPSAFLDGQKTSSPDFDPSSEDAEKTFDSPTTSERIPDTAPDCTDKPSAIADHSVHCVEFSYKNAIIERLQHGGKFNTNQICEAIIKRYPNYSINIDSIKRALFRGKDRTFKYVPTKNEPNNRHFGYWHMTESAMVNMKIAIMQKHIGVNTAEKPVRDNKSLPYFDIKASEERPSAFLDGQKTSSPDFDPSSEDAEKTFDSPTTSERIPDTAPAIADHSVHCVKFTYKHAIIECLQHGGKFNTNQICEAIIKRYTNYSINIDSIKRALFRGKDHTFKYVPTKNEPNRHFGYWHMTESAMVNMKIAIMQKHTTHDLALQRVAPIALQRVAPIALSETAPKLSCKNSIIKCLQDEEKMTINELFEKMNKKNQNISGKPAFSKSWINETLVMSKEFELSGSCRTASHKMTRCWRINKREKDNIINSFSGNIRKHSYKELLLAILKNKKGLTTSQIKQIFKEVHPQRAALDTRWKPHLINPLASNKTCFERVPNEKGVEIRGAGVLWRIKKDTNEYRESAIRAEAEKSKPANATPPIIQPGLPLPASLGVEPKDDREEDMQSILNQALDMQEENQVLDMQEGQHRASPSGQAILNAEQRLALQPEPPPVQFCSGIGFPLISQEYYVTMEFEDL